MPWEQRKPRGPEQEAGRTVPSLPGWPVGETEPGEMGKDACGRGGYRPAGEMLRTGSGNSSLKRL